MRGLDEVAWFAGTRNESSGDQNHDLRYSRTSCIEGPRVSRELEHDWYALGPQQHRHDHPPRPSRAGFNQGVLSASGRPHFGLMVTTLKRLTMNECYANPRPLNNETTLTP